MDESSGQKEQRGHCDEQTRRDNPHLAHAIWGGGETLAYRHGVIRGDGMSIRQ
jgi:hypothetical protein